LSPQAEPYNTKGFKAGVSRVAALCLTSPFVYPIEKGSAMRTSPFGESCMHMRSVQAFLFSSTNSVLQEHCTTANDQFLQAVDEH
jgi:hypothetical protein